MEHVQSSAPGVGLSLVVLLAPLLMGAGKLNYGIEIQSENDIRATIVYGVSRSDIAKAGKKLSDFADCDKFFEVSASDKARGQKPKSFEDKEYVGCQYTFDTTVDDARRVGLGVDFDAGGVYLSSGPKFFNYLLLDEFPVADFKVSVTFPGKVLSHSGSSTIDGNTVTWADVKDLKSGMKAASERPTGAASGGSSYWTSVGGRAVEGGLVGLIVGTVSYLGRKRRAKKNMRAKSAGASVPQQYPAYGQPQHQGQQAQAGNWQQQDRSVGIEGAEPSSQNGRDVGGPWRSSGSSNPLGSDGNSDPK